MRLAYLGTSEFAAIVLRRLAAGRHRPALVVTPPERRRGRGRRLAPPPAASVAAELGIAVHQTADVNQDESVAALSVAAIDVAVVCAFGQLLKAPVLERFELLNVHPSLLPRWRGAAPIERALMAGDEETGVAIIRVEADLDAGPVALCEHELIRPDDDYGTLAPRLAELGGELLARTLADREAGRLRFTEQSEDGMTYAEKIDPAERRLYPARPAAQLERTVRALNPHIGTFLELAGNERLGVRHATAVTGSAVAPGTISAVGEALVLGCAAGALRIDTVRPPGRREMAAADYLRGHDLPQLAAPGP